MIMIIYKNKCYNMQRILKNIILLVSTMSYHLQVIYYWQVDE